MNIIKLSSASSATLRHLLSSSGHQSRSITSTIRSISSFTLHVMKSSPNSQLPHGSSSATTLLSDHLPHSYLSVRFLSEKASSGSVGMSSDMSIPSQGRVRHIKDEEKENNDLVVDGKACLENKMRWGFIKKVYGIVTSQVLATAAVSSFIVFNPPLANFLVNTPYLFPSICVAGLGSLLSMHMVEKKYPYNVISLGAFTFIQSLMIGSCCSVIDGKIVLEAMGITAAAFSSLTGYTFWAAGKGKDFTFLGPLLFPCLVTAVATGLLQIFFPLPSGPASLIYSGGGAMLFLGYIVYDTDRLIKHFNYDQYLSASVRLYVDFINLYMFIMRILEELKK